MRSGRRQGKRMKLRLRPMVRSVAAQASLRSLRMLGCDATRLEPCGLIVRWRHSGARA
jgi:hypothetical protein